MFGFRNFGKTNTSNGIEKLCSALEEADAVIIGAGAGLSTSAGFYPCQLPLLDEIMVFS